MGHFYNPPPPSQGPVNSTLPIPHDPIPPQGDQPIRGQVVPVLAMVAVLASWPADLEPRLQTPNNQQNKIAPLTLTYGQQPQPTSFLPAPAFTTIVASWPLDYPPVFHPPTSAATLPPPPIVSPPPPRSTWPVVQTAAWYDETYYQIELVETWVVAPPNPDQPSPRPALSVTTLTQTVTAWQQTWDAQTAAKNAGWNVAPVLISLPYSPAPRHIWSAWDPAWMAPPAPVAIAALSLPTGTPPIPQGPLSVTGLAGVVASWPSAIGPLLGQPNDQRQKIAPLTLTTGQPPTPRAALAMPTLVQAVAAWTQTWDAQTAPKRLPVTQGTAPIPSGPLTGRVLPAIVATWAQDWTGQHAAPGAALIIPTTFQPQWATYSNQLIGPVAPQPVGES